MDEPVGSPAAVGSDRVARATDAYELFWNCVDNDMPSEEDSPPSDDEADAYHQYWCQAD